MEKEENTDNILDNTEDANIENKSSSEDESLQETKDTQEDLADAADNSIPASNEDSEIAEQDEKPISAAENETLSEMEADSLVTVRPVKFKEFEIIPPVRSVKKNYDIMQDISMHISVELGKTKASIKEVMDLNKGSIIELNKIAGEQVEIYVNEKLVAKGEVIVIEDKFGVRVTSTSLQKNSANS